MPCPACQTGPSGMAGHDDLMVLMVGDFRLLSKCRQCQSVWLRTSDRNGHYTWAPAAEGMANRGVLLPPRSRSPQNA